MILQKLWKKIKKILKIIVKLKIKFYFKLKLKEANVIYVDGFIILINVLLCFYHQIIKKSYKKLWKIKYKIEILFINQEEKEKIKFLKIFKWKDRLL